METRLSQIALVLLTALLTSCSKHSSSPEVNPGHIDFGVVQVGTTATNHFDHDLGSNQFCVIKSFITADQKIVTSAAIEVRGPKIRGGAQPLITFNPETNSPGQPVKFSNGYYQITCQPQVQQ